MVNMTSLVMPAVVGGHPSLPWIPAYAGMTNVVIPEAVCPESIFWTPAPAFAGTGYARMTSHKNLAPVPGFHGKTRSGIVRRMKFKFLMYAIIHHA